MNLNIQKKLIYLAILFFLIIGVILILLYNSIKSQSNIKNDEITPSVIKPTSYQIGPTKKPALPPIPAQSTKYKKSLEKIATVESDLISKESDVGKLLKQLPYNGKNFRMENDYNKAQFVVTIPKGKEKEGNEELDQFLKQNSIGDRSWIRNLVIKYQ